FFPENDNGPFPKYMVKVRRGTDVEINYRLTGPGADEPPQGLFTVNRRTGVLQVTQPLDREKIHTYTLWVHAIYAHHGDKAEEPMELTIHVIDQNDDKPEFTQSSFYGTVSESAIAGDAVMQITATDRDDPDTDHAMIKYEIVSQTPEVPSKDMFAINPLSGVVSVTRGGLDREALWEYALIVEARDMNGDGLSTTCSVVITVTDSNDHAPQFSNASASASVSENKAGVEVFRFRVTDEDELGSGGHFRISTGPDRMEGVLTTAKELDFESAPFYILLVVVTNEATFVGPVSTSTATLTVTVEDRNEPPMLAPSKIHATVPENAALGSSVTYLRAIDPDTARATRIWFKLLSDAAGWLSLDQHTGRVSVRNGLDRESHFVQDDRYSVLVLAYDNDTVPETGTGTLIVTLLDVNDHAPVIQQRSISLCDTDPVPVQLDIEDPDSPGNTAPFTVELQGQHRLHWNIHTNSSNILDERRMALGWSTLLLRVYDTRLLYQDSTLAVEVCQCEGALISCTMPRSDPLQHEPSHLALALGAVFALLLLLLLFILRRRKRLKEDVALLKDPPRDNICCYDEEGGGEDDQVSASDNNSVLLNLAAADADPCAPPYDSLLVFDFEGAGSEADSLSSLDSSDSERDQDFGPLLDWGPGFGRLADMYTGGMDDNDDDTLPGKTEWV
uniref:Cadherin-1 n=1 Tax=Neogobius melanostomus TaxID=47308 RepID=A0A8C6UJ66_9GOBI